MQISKKMKPGITMVLIATLSATLLTIPTKVTMAQTSPGNQTMQGMSDNQAKMLKALIAMKVVQIRSSHPLLAAIADKIQTMDIKDTLRYLLGVEIVTNLLKAHANELTSQSASNQTVTQ
ncbi:MAG TPA: hypothetical protein VH796_18100 [Nitrososphaeraceae archaeon]|jgi:predicted ABC-class ATPase